MVFEKGHPQYNTGRTWFKKGCINLNKGKDITLFPKVTPNYDVGYALGTIIGDGNLYSHPDLSQGRHIIRLRVTSYEFANEFKSSLERITNKKIKVIPYNPIIKGKRIKCYRVYCHSKSYLKYFKYLRDNLKNFLSNADIPTIRGFIKGYIDSEGNVNAHGNSIYIHIRSINQEHINQIKDCLKKLHFHTFEGIYRTNLGKPLYSISISGIYFVRKYATQIGFSDPNKQMLALSKNYKDEKWLKIAKEKELLV